MSENMVQLLTDWADEMNMSIQQKIKKHLYRWGRGSVFTSKDMMHVGTRDAVDQSLARLSKDGTIRRLGRGLFWYPRRNSRLGIVVPPDTDQIARAIARRTGARVMPSGAVAANKLGLTTQVPSKAVYLTDGPSRTLTVDDRVFIMQHTAAKIFHINDLTIASVIQALLYLGIDGVDDVVVAKLRNMLSDQQRKRLLQNARYTTSWIMDIARRMSA